MKKRFLWRTFRAPLLLAMLTSVGLMSGLLGDLAWDWLSWLALTWPLAVIAQGFCAKTRA